MAVNISEVRLLAVPLQSDYKNTGYFESATAQYNYFTSKAKLSTTNVSYIKDNTFTYPADFDDLQNVNYVMYKNAAYNDKWFYAFITDKERLNDGATKVHIKTDSIQTYLFDYEVGYCFVEREHVNSDNVGEHTVPENLETGEYVCWVDRSYDNLKTTDIVVGATLDLNNYTNQPDDWNLTKEYKPAYGATYDGLYSGIKYFVMSQTQLAETLKNLAYEGQDDAVHTIFTAPRYFLKKGTAGTHGTPIVSSASPISDDWVCAVKPSNLDGYTPKNKKLLTYPYCYLMLDNGGGNAVIYHYEKFGKLILDGEDHVKFKIYGVTTPGMSIRAVPANYNGVSENDSEGLNLSKYAQCSWTSDAYTAWLAKNGVNVGLTTVTGLAAAGIGIAGALATPVTGGASLAVAGAIVGGVGAVGSQVASVVQHSQIPPQLNGNVNGGDVQTARGAVTFTSYSMTIKSEYAKIIDGYFTNFGYKVNTFKAPNKNHRKYFWYTKTTDSVILGDIPQEDLQAIKNCYDKGVTFWKNPDNIGKITDNPIV